MPGLHPGDQSAAGPTRATFAGVAKQVDAPRPERDALRRTAGSTPAAGTQSSQLSTGKSARLTTTRSARTKSRQRLQFIRSSGRGEIGSRNRLKSGRVERLV